MGYQTDFTGELKFTSDLTARQLAKVKSFLGEDWREHPEWECPDPDAYLTYIDLELLDDFSGLEWSGSEKTNGMVESVNLIVAEMRKEWPDFGLTGKLLAQGEEVGDVWELVIGDDGLARRVDVPLTGTKVTCPHCDGQFVIGDKWLARARGHRRPIAVSYGFHLPQIVFDITRRESRPGA